jgi:hypothetical protein
MKLGMDEKLRVNVLCLMTTVSVEEWWSGSPLNACYHSTPDVRKLLPLMTLLIIALSASNFYC